MNITISRDFLLVIIVISILGGIDIDICDLGLTSLVRVDIAVSLLISFEGGPILLEVGSDIFASE